MFSAVAASKVEDVREVLDFYKQFDDPLEAFKDNQRKLQVKIPHSEGHILFDNFVDYISPLVIFSTKFYAFMKQNDVIIHGGGGHCGSDRIVIGFISAYHH
jgi:hypothetical protein